jgi:hypothetical protein
LDDRVLIGQSYKRDKAGRERLKLSLFSHVYFWVGNQIENVTVGIGNRKKTVFDASKGIVAPLKKTFLITKMYELFF